MFLCCFLFVKLLSFLSLSLPPSLPACLCSSLPLSLSLWDSRQERNWSSFPWEACLCVRIGRIPWVPLPSMQRSWREMQCWSRGWAGPGRWLEAQGGWDPGLAKGWNHRNVSPGSALRIPRPPWILEFPSLFSFTFALSYFLLRWPQICKRHLREAIY